MIEQIRYETSMKDVDFNKPTVFLAGPTIRGHQTHLKSWRPDAVKLFQEYGFEGNIIIPEFTNPTVSDKYRYDLPAWEFEGLRNSNVILFWVCRSRELIGLTTNYELGYWVAKDRKKIVYGRPDDAYRINYSDIMWYEDGKLNGDNECPIYNTLEKTVEATMNKLNMYVKLPF
jgi:nucleoside 2-deoxyribosyltransferase